MKFIRSKRETVISDRSSPIARRDLVVGAGVASAAAIAAAVLHRQVRTTTDLAAAVPPAAADGGYQVTPHVLRYYETTRS